MTGITKYLTIMMCGKEVKKDGMKYILSRELDNNGLNHETYKLFKNINQKILKNVYPLK